MNRKFLPPFFILLAAVVSMAQEPYFKHYNADNGLSRNTVLTTLLSEKGYLWIGTKDGLNRFDGRTFKIFRKEVGEGNGLGSNYIESLHEHAGMLWVGTGSGLYAFDATKNSFGLVNATSKGLIHDIEHDADGNIWYTSGYTLFRHSLATKETFIYDSKKFSYADELARDMKGNLWAAYGNKLFRYKKETDDFETFEIGENISKGIPLKISKLFSLNENTLLVGTENHGVVTFDMTTGNAKKLFTGDKGQLFVRDFFVKNGTDLWIATESGIFIHNLRTGNTEHLKKDLGNPYSLSDNATYSITEDREGGMWIGSYFGGLDYYPQQRLPFKKYFQQPDTNSINGEAIREIRADTKGHLWIGSEDGGLNKMDMATGTFTNYFPNADDSEISHFNIHALLPQGNLIWVGTFERGLDIMDIETGKILKHFEKGGKHNIPGNFILALYATSDDEILAATSVGLFSYQAETDDFVMHGGFSENVFFTSILEDHKNRLWAGSFGDGLYRYDADTGKKSRYTQDRTLDKSSGIQYINGLFQDSKNRVWITTEDGLYLYREDTDNFERYSTQQGFPSNVFYAILEDAQYNLWISTSKGLAKFDPEGENVSTYTKAHGLLSDQFNYMSAFKADNGTLYFGSVGGMISFNPTEIDSSKAYVPPLYITDLSVNSSSAPSDSGLPSPTDSGGTPEVELAPQQSSFSVAFAALGYTAPEVTEYWYRFKNQTEDWTYLKNTPTVNFTELPPGNYMLDVKSKDINGTESRLAEPLRIKLRPTFWQSNLAYILYVLLLFFLGYLVFNYFHIKAKARNYRFMSELNKKRDKEVFQAKIDFFTNVSHEIRTPLTLIKTPLEKLLQQRVSDAELTENLSIMEKNTGRLLDLTNQLLDFRQAEIENTSLTFVHTNISELIRSTYKRFTPAIIDRSLIVNLDLKEEDIFAFVDQEAMKKIVSNLFSNALKYGERKIAVSLSDAGENFEFRISNDGYIIPSHLREKIFQPFFRNAEADQVNRVGTGIGLSLARSLTELHHGQLELDMSSAESNNFVLCIPIHQENEIKLEETYQTSNPLSTTSDNENRTGIDVKPTLLIIEDNVDLLDFISKDLSCDYLVLKAANADQAQELIKLEPITLIVSDVMMPGMTGFELCEKLKSDIETSHIPIILLTVKSTLSAKLTGLEHGADAFIEKPFSIDHLKIQIANLIKNRSKIIDHYSSSPFAHIRSMAHTKTDENFIQKLDAHIMENLSDPEMNVDILAEKMHMSRSTFYRKIKELSNMNPNELLNIARLKKAAELLGTGRYKIYQVAEMVGYKSQSSFTRSFQKQFNITPTEYMKIEGA